jgi:hypothetical protein
MEGHGTTPREKSGTSSTHFISYGLCRTTEDRLNQHRATDLQEISVRIVIVAIL